MMLQASNWFPYSLLHNSVFTFSTSYLADKDNQSLLSNLTLKSAKFSWSTSRSVTVGAVRWIILAEIFVKNINLGEEQ